MLGHQAVLDHSERRGREDGGEIEGEERGGGEDQPHDWFISDSEKLNCLFVMKLRSERKVVTENCLLLPMERWRERETE